MNRSQSKGRRLAVVLSHPTQYYSPWFQWLHRQTSVEFRVFYLWDFGVAQRHDPNFGTSITWDVDLLSGYESEFVPNRSAKPGAEHFFGFNNPELTKRLALWRPDAVLIFGYKWASHLRAIAWARLNGVPLLFRGDSHLIGRQHPPLFVRICLRILFAQFAAFLPVGSANKGYFEAFGVPARKLFFAPHSVNAALFDRSRGQIALEASELRTALGLRPSTAVVLFAGKLVSGKQPMELLRAFLNLRPVDTALLFVGEGAEKGKLERTAADALSADSGSMVRFLPFANQSEMPSRYLLADVFVLPSLGETWGLAVNEAMHMGVPCIVSDRVGCQSDLVTNGETGWVFEAADPEGLKRALSSALGDVGIAPRKVEIQRAVAQRISTYTYEQTTSGLLAALSALDT
ncbi:MAG TPA: glycosyltransferase family 4 protein [Opitutaceae bacterium]